MKIGTHLRTSIDIVRFCLSVGVTILMTTTVIMVFGFSHDTILGYMLDNVILTVVISAALGIAASAAVDRGLGKMYVSAIISILDKQRKSWTFFAKLVSVSVLLIALGRLALSATFTFSSAKYISIETTAPPDASEAIGIGKAKDRAKAEAKKGNAASKSDYDQAVKQADEYLRQQVAVGTARQQVFYRDGNLGELRVKGSPYYDVKYARAIEAAQKKSAGMKAAALANYETAKAAIAQEVKAIEAAPEFSAALSAVAKKQERGEFLGGLKKFVLYAFDFVGAFFFVVAGFILAVYINEAAAGDEKAYEHLMDMYFPQEPGLPEVVSMLAASMYGAVVATFAWFVAKVQGRGASLFSIVSSDVKSSSALWRDAAKTFNEAASGTAGTDDRDKRDSSRDSQRDSRDSMAGQQAAYQRQPAQTKAYSPPTPPMRVGDSTDFTDAGPIREAGQQTAGTAGQQRDSRDSEVEAARIRTLKDNIRRYANRAKEYAAESERLQAAGDMPGANEKQKQALDTTATRQRFIHELESLEG